eukprot:scaffold158947_cov19-Prasinocladus_malaysianus.AAC.1
MEVALCKYVAGTPRGIDGHASQLLNQFCLHMTHSCFVRACDGPRVQIGRTSPPFCRGGSCWEARMVGVSYIASDPCTAPVATW